MLRERIIELRASRESSKSKNRRARHHGLSRAERDEILRKTDGRCHICGGVIRGEWHADHVLARSVGGEHKIENYLPAHRTCNNYRWDYLAEEFELILKLGVWARTQIELNTRVGQEICSRFEKHEAKRRARRKTKMGG